MKKEIQMGCPDRIYVRNEQDQDHEQHTLLQRHTKRWVIVGYSVVDDCKLTPILTCADIDSFLQVADANEIHEIVSKKPVIAKPTTPPFSPCVVRSFLAQRLYTGEAKGDLTRSLSHLTAPSGVA